MSVWTSPQWILTCTEATVWSMCAEVYWSGAEPPEAAPEPGAGSVSEGGIHLHCSGSASFSGPTPAQEYRPAQCFKYWMIFFFCYSWVLVSNCVSTVCWQEMAHFTTDANWKNKCFLCSIRASSLLYNHAPEPLPAMHRCIHPASCIWVQQGRFTSTNVSSWHFKK